MSDVLSQPLTLPCGAVLPNRIAKAAMTEGLATAAGVPTPELERLYGVWSDGGAGLLLTGNIQIDADHLGTELDLEHLQAQGARRLDPWVEVDLLTSGHLDGVSVDGVGSGGKRQRVGQGQRLGESLLGELVDCLCVGQLECLPLCWRYCEKH